MREGERYVADVDRFESAHISFEVSLCHKCGMEVAGIRDNLREFPPFTQQHHNDRLGDR